MCVAFLELRRSEEYFPKNALFSFKKKEKKPQMKQKDPTNKQNRPQNPNKTKKL